MIKKKQIEIILSEINILEEGVSSMDLWNTVYENSENGYFRQGKMWSSKCNKKYTLTGRGRE
jgi:hypothetical protein